MLSLVQGGPGSVRAAARLAAEPEVGKSPKSHQLLSWLVHFSASSLLGSVPPAFLLGSEPFNPARRCWLLRSPRWRAGDTLQHRPAPQPGGFVGNDTARESSALCLGELWRVIPPFLTLRPQAEPCGIPGGPLEQKALAVPDAGVCSKG